MVTIGEVMVQQDSVQRRGGSHLDTHLLPQFTAKGRISSFAEIDTTSREVPPTHVSVSNEQDSTFCVYDSAPDSDRHTMKKSSIKTVQSDNNGEFPDHC